jgi:tRNA(Ile)-lysidine synthase
VTPKPIAADAETVSQALGDALRQCVQQAGCQPSSQRPLLVAFSGGADSTALLHVAASVWSGAVWAVHVHHGLQTSADRFETHCMGVCANWGVPIRVVKLNLTIHRGDSTEEKAREGRYGALASVSESLSGCAVLLGQHANDQLETVLLALSRGAGVSGLAGMPVEKHWHGHTFLRPWLALPGQVIRDYVRAFELPFVDDPSNANVAFTRNRIRQMLVPQLLEAFPSLLDTVGRSARHCAQASRLLDEQARLDFPEDGALYLSHLRSLPADSLANLLRYWLRREGARPPTSKQLEQLMQQIQRASTRGHRLDVPVSGGKVQRDGALLRYVPHPAAKS